jgi:hypothetical protein
VGAHYLHLDPSFPKIFISQYLIENAPTKFAKIIDHMEDSIDREQTKRVSFLGSGRRWDIGHAEYQELSKASEYLAWFYAFGFRANHFTISCNDLSSFNSLAELNHFIKDAGFCLNSSGSEIKGSVKEGLEQSSTMASKVDWNFKDGTFTIPACYLEFAKRYAVENGDIFQGFISSSANYIFESTNKAIC